MARLADCSIHGFGDCGEPEVHANPGFRRLVTDTGGCDIEARCHQRHFAGAARKMGADANEDREGRNEKDGATGADGVA